MKTKALQVKTQMEIAKPVYEVFEAIVDPEKMSHYFISSGTGRMQGGKTVHWKFDKGGGLDARVERTEPDRFVSFVWSASGIEALVANGTGAGWRYRDRGKNIRVGLAARRKRDCQMH